MKQNRTKSWWKNNRWQWAGLLLTVVFLLMLPANLTLAEETDPPDASRGGEEFLYPTEEDNRDLTRGMMYMGGLMVLVVVAGTLRVLQLDRVNRPHLLRPRQKRQLPDATIRKTPITAVEPEAVEEKQAS